MVKFQCVELFGILEFSLYISYYGMTIAASIRETIFPNTLVPTVRSRLFIFSFYDQISCKRSKIWYDKREFIYEMEHRYGVSEKSGKIDSV